VRKIMALKPSAISRCCSCACAAHPSRCSLVPLKQLSGAVVGTQQHTMASPRTWSDLCRTDDGLPAFGGAPHRNLLAEGRSTNPRALPSSPLVLGESGRAWSERAAGRSRAPARGELAEVQVERAAPRARCWRARPSWTPGAPSGRASRKWCLGPARARSRSRPSCARWPATSRS